ncbi:hypothetical protein Krad_2322 [Kineococcus radiotolerans SRS30216 = ATCC BAA-149]|uniref:Uncharacterized protein n=1 Tax=Kineococcus radiotolerans (strain ATCC BAA-149 / DSM 14245 / SRS30216) TaxID=266940 RepID=A6WAG4_KINRD|nr:hypothetical protein Krad_2322 [Kineococcus radiotolerans SRS30216 = ATCC BAA-149]
MSIDQHVTTLLKHFFAAGCGVPRNVLLDRQSRGQAGRER